MASVMRRGDGWCVRWRELRVTVDEQGAEHREWLWKKRQCPTERAAKELSREIETLASRGVTWRDQREDAVATIRAVVLAYTRAAVDAGAPLATQRFRSATIGSLLDFIDGREEGDPGARMPVTELSLPFLERYARSLNGDGRAAQTRYRKVLEAERMWAWAEERPELFPGVPRPRRYTGSSSDADKLRPPPPVVAVAAPTWGDVDAMVGRLFIPWHRNVALLMRFTGMRASQACGLDWHDVDLERRVLRLRAGVRGAKRGRARVIPLHPWLAESMTTWGDREGVVFRRRYKAPDGSIRTDAYRGDALVEPFRRAWSLAGVATEKWDIPDGDADAERGRGSPTHALRRCIRTELLRSGVEEAVVLYLVGQSQGLTAAAYVPESSPEQSPYWSRLVDAVAKIPTPTLELRR